MKEPVMEEGSLNWDLASNLVGTGMRLTLVHALTGVCPSRLRGHHKKVNGQSAPPGRTPEYAHILIKNKEQALEASKFINYYDVISALKGNGNGNRRAVDPQVMLEAYKFYANTAKSPLNINLALYVIRDLVGGRLESRKCSRCGVSFVFSSDNEALQQCPMC
jgi:hypothetical protein